MESVRDGTRAERRHMLIAGIPIIFYVGLLAFGIWTGKARTESGSREAWRHKAAAPGSHPLRTNWG